MTTRMRRRAARATSPRTRTRTARSLPSPRMVKPRSRYVFLLHLLLCSLPFGALTLYGRAVIAKCAHRSRQAHEQLCAFVRLRRRRQVVHHHAALRAGHGPPAAGVAGGEHCPQDCGPRHGGHQALHPFQERSGTASVLCVCCCPCCSFPSCTNLFFLPLSLPLPRIFVSLISRYVCVSLTSSFDRP